MACSPIHINRDFATTDNGDWAFNKNSVLKAKPQGEDLTVSPAGGCLTSMDINVGAEVIGRQTQTDSVRPLINQQQSHTASELRTTCSHRIYTKHR